MKKAPRDERGKPPPFNTPRPPKPKKLHDNCPDCGADGPHECSWKIAQQRREDACDE